MSFWKRIFGISDTNKTTSPTQVIQSHDSSTHLSSKANQKFNSLLKEVQPLCHADAPLFRKDYSALSNMPAVDYSYWITQQLVEQDFEALWLFVKSYYGDYVERSTFDLFLDKDFISYLNADNQLIDEVRSFFILRRGVDDFNREFWIAEDGESELLARILSAHSFGVKKENIKPLLNKANNFLKKMKADKDTDYWHHYSFIEETNIKTNYQPIFLSDLGNKLKTLSLGERLLLFDYACNKPLKKFWNGESWYGTRCFGIYEPIALQKVLDTGIFEQVSDLESIPEICPKAELKSSAEENGFEIKKSWTLAKIHENLMSIEKGRTFLGEFLKGRKVFKLKDEYSADIQELVTYKENIRVVSNLLAMV